MCLIIRIRFACLPAFTRMFSLLSCSRLCVHPITANLVEAYQRKRKPYSCEKRRLNTTSTYLPLLYLRMAYKISNRGDVDNASSSSSLEHLQDNYSIAFDYTANIDDVKNRFFNLVYLAMQKRKLRGICGGVLNKLAFHGI